MHEESISQAEIDALVRGATGARTAEASFAPGWGPEDASLLHEPLQEYAAFAGRALADLVGTSSEGRLADLLPTTAQAVGGMAGSPVLVGRATLTSGLTGTICYAVPQQVGLSIITQIYGGVAPSALDDSALGALSDGLTQMNHVGLTRLADLLGFPIYAGPVEIMGGANASELLGLSPSSSVLMAGIDLAVGDETGRLFLVLPKDVALAINQAMKAARAASAKSSRTAAAPAAPARPAGSAASAPAPAAASSAPARQAAAVALSSYQPARFPEAAAQRGGPRDETRNIELLLDVSLHVTVELGRTRKQIRDVLSLGPGSVLELDKLAGEQVDVLVNGKLIAKGEVVVIDENYGVRITDIISPVERVQSLR